MRSRMLLASRDKRRYSLPFAAVVPSTAAACLTLPSPFRAGQLAIFERESSSKLAWQALNFLIHECRRSAARLRLGQRGATRGLAMAVTPSNLRSLLYSPRLSGVGTLSAVQRLIKFDRANAVAVLAIPDVLVVSPVARFDVLWLVLGWSPRRSPHSMEV